MGEAYNDLYNSPLLEMYLQVSDEERLEGVNEKWQLACGCVKRWYGGFVGFREKRYREHVNQYTLSDGNVVCIANSYRCEMTLCQSCEEVDRSWREADMEALDRECEELRIGQHQSLDSAAL